MIGLVGDATRVQTLTCLTIWAEAGLRRLMEAAFCFLHNRRRGVVRSLTASRPYSGHAAYCHTTSARRAIFCYNGSARETNNTFVESVNDTFNAHETNMPSCKRRRNSKIALLVCRASPMQSVAIGWHTRLCSTGVQGPN